MKKLRDLEEKSSQNNVLVIRPEGSKNTPYPFSDAFAKGKTVYYDETKHEGEISINSSVIIEITEDLLYHIADNVDKIIFYGTEERYEGLVYEKKRMRLNVPEIVFFHVSHDPESEKYNDTEIDTIICGIMRRGESTDWYPVISKVGQPM